MRVLIIEDDRATAEFIAKGFEAAGYTAAIASTGTEGLAKAVGESVDIAIIDVMLPGASGFDIVRQVRQRRLNYPIIMLSARSEEASKVRGLEAGADDYQTKPFSLTELLARAAAQLRRATATAEPTELRVADLRLDLMGRKAYRGDVRITLQPLEWQLLEFLMRNKGASCPA